MNSSFHLQMLCMCKMLKMELSIGMGWRYKMGELVWAGDASVLRTLSTL